MLYDYELISLHDSLEGSGNPSKRRLVTADVLVIEIAEHATEMAHDHSIRVTWPAYGNEHHTASVDYAERLNARINHVEAAKISSMLKKYVGEIK